MKQKRWINTIVCTLLASGMVSCTANFKEYNTNPNNTTEEELQKDNLFLGAFFVKMIQNVFPYGGTGSTSTNAYQVVENLCGDAFGGYNGQTHNWSKSGDQLSYNFSLEWNSAPFSSFYTGVLGNWSLIKNKTEQDYPDLFAVSQIIKVYAAQRTTDIYGPIPYSKAGVGIGSAYDSQQDIYYSFFDDLNQAVETLRPYAAQGVSLLHLFDDMYGGNYAQWIKFANSLKLRAAMRIVYADPVRAQKEAESALADSYGVITANADNAYIRGVQGSNRIFGNPLHGLTNDYNEARMSANMESFLVGYNDPRIDKLFYPATNIEDQTHSQPRSPIVYLGVRSGININDQQAKHYVSYSKLRTDFPIMWMNAAEVYFLRAEGALRGWNMKGEAEELYKKGVETSFDQWKASGYSSYINNSTAKPAPYNDEANGGNSIGEGSRLSTITIAWNNDDNFETKLERIITQKWIAMYPNGQEAWSEFRRTHYPKLFPVADNRSSGTVSTNEQIRRLPYPKNESENNVENYKVALTLLNGGDTGGTKVWWDKK